MAKKRVKRTPTKKSIKKINLSDDFWNKFWRDKNGKIVVGQMPNVWIVLWLIFELFALLSSSNFIATISHWGAIISLGIWAFLELFQGVNYFRKSLGFIFVIVTIMSIFGKGI